jgi:plastocyanin
MKKALMVFSACAFVASGLAACGGGGGSSSTPTGGGASAGGGGTVLKLSADPNGAFKFSTDKLTAKKGPVTIDFNNPASLSHDITLIDRNNRELARTDLVAQGKTSLSVNLKPGKYTYYCSVPGHRQGGMEGTLTVK